MAYIIILIIHLIIVAIWFFLCETYLVGMEKNFNYSASVIFISFFGIKFIYDAVSSESNVGKIQTMFFAKHDTSIQKIEQLLCCAYILFFLLSFPKLFDLNLRSDTFTIFKVYHVIVSILIFSLFYFTIYIFTNNIKLSSVLSALLFLPSMFVFEKAFYKASILIGGKGIAWLLILLASSLIIISWKYSKSR